MDGWMEGWFVWGGGEFGAGKVKRDEASASFPSITPPITPSTLPTSNDAFTKAQSMAIPDPSTQSTQSLHLIHPTNPLLARTTARSGHSEPKRKAQR